VRSRTMSSNEPNGRTAMSNATYRPTTMSADTFIGDDVSIPILKKHFSKQHMQNIQTSVYKNLELISTDSEVYD
jgi:hypothetical protein